MEEKKEGSPGGNLQVYSIITGKDPSWQGIIYDLINSEQIDPWNIDISFLCNKYFEKIREMEEQDFFVSSKILLAASLLLRIKSEILLNSHIKEIDEVLFGKKEEENVRPFERIELDENDIPILSPKTPMPRFKKVTLPELINALDTAIKTESRRINREIAKKQTERLAYIDLPKFKRINIKDRARHFYAKILSSFKHPDLQGSLKVSYSHFTKDKKEEKIACFLPMLHLSNGKKLWLEQDGHFEEIYMYLYDVFKKNFPDYDKEIVELERELEEDMKQMRDAMEDEKRQMVEDLNEDFENPINDMITDSPDESEE